MRIFGRRRALVAQPCQSSGKDFQSQRKENPNPEEGKSKPREAKSKLFSSANRDFSKGCGRIQIDSLDSLRLGRFRCVRAQTPGRLRRRLRGFSPLQSGGDAVDLGEQPLSRRFVVRLLGRRRALVTVDLGENLEIGRNRFDLVSPSATASAASRSACSRRASCSIAWSDPPSTCRRCNASPTVWRTRRIVTCSSRAMSS
jgi:hypothetical protein